MNKWLVLLITENIKVGYKWAMQIRSLYRAEDVEPILSSLDDSEKYLQQRNVALCVLELPKDEPSKKLRQLSSMIQFYKLDCELLVVGDEDAQVLRAVRDCGRRFLKQVDSNEALEKLLKELIAKRTGTGYREVFDANAKIARLEERTAIQQDRLTEILAEFTNLNDCLFGGPNYPGWDRRLDALEAQFGFIQETLNQIQFNQSEELTVLKNQMGILVVRSIFRFILIEGWHWILEHPFQAAGVVGAIAAVVTALILN